MALQDKARVRTTVLEPIGGVLVEKIDGKHVKVYFAVVNKTIAQRLLDKHNEQNRPLVKAQVARLVEEMRAGHFRTIHQGFAFDRDGNGIDLQHRCMAIVETDTAHTFLVSEGWDPISRALIDGVATRNLAQNLAMMGISAQPIAVAAVVNFLRRHVEHTTVKIGIESAQDYLKRHRSGFVWMSEHVANRHGRGTAVTAIVAAFVYAAPRLGADAMKRAWDDLQSGAGLTVDDPIWLLREEAVSKQSQSYATRDTMFRKTLNALYIRHQGRRCKQLKINEGAFAFFAEAYR